MSWYNNDDAFTQNTKKNYTRRFWMPKDTERLITFVDTPIVELEGIKIQTPFKYNEYQIQHNGHYRNWFTKPLNKEEDVLDGMDYRASRVAALTIVDHSEWEDRKGVKHKDELVLYVVKRSSAIWKQIEKQINRHGSLAGKTFNISRLGDRSAGAGDMLEKHDQDFQLDPEIHKPFNYLEILKPRPKKDIEALFKEPEDPFKQQQAEQQSWNNQEQQQVWNSQPQQQQQSWNTHPQQHSWNNQPQQPAQSWNNPPPQEQHRVYGAVGGGNQGGSDPIPF